MFTDRHTAYCWWTDPAQKLTPAHLLSPAALLPCWQGRGTLITLDGTLELRAAWNNWDIQTPSCPRLQMLTWVCGQGDSGQGRTSCPQLSRAESGEWRVWFIVPECQLNVNLQTSSRSWAQEQEPAECGNISVFISLVVRPGDTDIVLPVTSRCHSPSNQLIDAIVATCQIFSSCPRVKTNVLQGSTFNDKVWKQCYLTSSRLSFHVRK